MKKEFNTDFLKITNSNRIDEKSAKIRALISKVGLENGSELKLPIHRFGTIIRVSLAKHPR